MDPDLLPELVKLTHQLEHGQRISQPRLRHRYQIDRVGLQRSAHRLVGDDNDVAFDFDDVQGSPAQQVLGAVYAAGDLPVTSRSGVFTAVRRAIGWSGPIGDDLLATLAGRGRGRILSAGAFGDPVNWAMGILGFVNGSGRPTNGDGPSRSDVQRRFRQMLRDAHPDHGGASDDAARRIADLTEARRILLG